MVAYSGTQIRISWTAPFNNGAAIVQYKIEILQNPNDGSAYFLDLTNCDGSQSDILALLSCTIPMQTLRNMPFNL
jgi:hypothetical protein